MLYSSFLALHLFGAGATAVVAAYAAVVLWRREEGRYRVCAMTLGLIAGSEVVTGTILAILSARITALSLCGNIAIYLSIVLLLEMILFVRMKKVSVQFPIIRTFSPIALSLFGIFTAALYGF